MNKRIAKKTAFHLGITIIIFIATVLALSIIQLRNFAPIIATKRLLSAAKAASVYDVAWLIAKGANVNAVDKDKMTPLMLAAGSNSNPGVIHVLIDNGADTNVVDKDGRTPLMIAAEKNSNPEVLRILRENGAGVAIEDESHKRLLAYAKRNKTLTVKDVYRLLGWKEPVFYIIHVFFIFASYGPGGERDLRSVDMGFYLGMGPYLDIGLLVIDRIMVVIGVFVLLHCAFEVASTLRDTYIFLLKAYERRKL